jgi:rubrerythrin
MDDKDKKQKLKTTKPKKETIQFGKDTDICFACGEKLKSNTKVCPYCGVKQK